MTSPARVCVPSRSLYSGKVNIHLGGCSTCITETGASRTHIFLLSHPLLPSKPVANLVPACANMGDRISYLRYTLNTEPMSHLKRRNRLRKLIDADAMLVSNEINVRYLTGFTGDSSLLIVRSSGEDELVSDPRYEEQIAEECPGLATFIRQPSQRTFDVVCQRLDAMEIAQLVVEANSLTMSLFERLQALTQVESFLSGAGEVEQLRAIKDKSEIKIIRDAVQIAERAFRIFREQLMPHQTEKELAYELERVIRALGGDRCGFDPIVAVGPRASLAHAVPGDSRVGDDPLLLVDWGAEFKGYRSDQTRVLFNKRPSARILKAYEAVYESQQKTIEALKPGIMVSEIDRIARDVVASHKLAKRFNHGLGHGIGLEIHEAPFIGKNDDQPLREGMVVTVEPGVYFQGLGGVRLEDDLLITKTGAEQLCTLPKEIEHAYYSFLGT